MLKYVSIFIAIKGFPWPILLFRVQNMDMTYNVDENLSTIGWLGGRLLNDGILTAEVIYYWIRREDSDLK
jgi:hypothetical protein